MDPNRNNHSQSSKNVDISFNKHSSPRLIANKLINISRPIFRRQNYHQTLGILFLLSLIYKHIIN